MALLHQAAHSGRRIFAATVDHGLRPESAGEAEMVAEFCKSAKIPHATLKWTGRKPKTGIENAARIARYDLLLDYAKKNNIGIILTAHQADDQCETFFMNLARGSGVYGLAGIRPQTERDGIIIARPLLNVPRAELESYCIKNKIPFVRDKMNDDEKFARVKIRKNRAILGLDDSRILLAMENLSRLRDYAEAEAKRYVKKIPVEMDAGMLLNLPDEIRYRALSEMLADNYPIRLDSIKRAFAKLDSGKCKFTLAGKNIRLLNGKIRIWKEGEKWRRK